jgi:hypothetical protein
MGKQVNFFAVDRDHDEIIRALDALEMRLRSTAADVGALPSRRPNVLDDSRSPP